VSERRTFTMRDVMAEFHDGPHATPPAADEGPIFLGIKNITDSGLLDLTEVRHIAERDFERWTRRATPQPGDVVFTYEATLHRYALIPDGFRGCLGRRLALIRPDPSVVLPRYLHFAMLGPEWRTTVSKRVIPGSTVDRIPLIDFPNFPITLPDLKTQSKVVEILGALDDLIENNRRRIALLEQMAQAIYREWFVHFRYPGHEDDELADSVLGRIPQGWETRRVADVGEVTVGGDWGADEPKDDGWVQVVCIRGVDIRSLTTSGETDASVRWVKAGSLDKRRVAETDVIIEGSGDCGNALAATFDLEGLLGLPVIYSNFCKRIRFPTRAVARYVARFLNQMVANGAMKSFVTGTAIPNLNLAGLVSTVDIVVPPMVLLQRFDDFCAPLDALRFDGRNRTLSNVRDLLLPKLVTGAIDVSNLDLGEAPAA
jgi:type I restriction enzyme, S subunit